MNFSVLRNWRARNTIHSDYGRLVRIPHSFDKVHMQSDRPTIFALSSGRPPAAVAVIRVCGPKASVALERLIGRAPRPRQATLARLREPASGEVVDEALALWFPGPRSETGEDMAELQVHGGQAVIAAVLDALGQGRRLPSR